MKTSECLETALSLTGGDRANTHGDKAANFRITAAMWTAFLDDKLTVPITECEAAEMMAIMKSARTRTGAHNPDDYIDQCGYAAIAGELAEEQEEYISIPHIGLVVNGD